jgi:hypothetical protein
VIGRILDDLLEAFPDVGDHTDLIVAENGAVLACGRPWARPGCAGARRIGRGAGSPRCSLPSR